MLAFILITIFVIWLIGVILRWGFRLWLVRKQREMAERFGQFGQQFGGGQRHYNQPDARAEGDVDLQQTARIEKKVSRNVGEYVEFEEVCEEEEGGNCKF